MTPNLNDLADRLESFIPRGDGYNSDYANTLAEVVEVLRAKAASHGEQVREALEWAVERWYAEVSQRPLHNVHRRSIDDTWRQVIRRLGGDPAELCGPDHDTLIAAAPSAGSQEQGEWACS